MRKLIFILFVIVLFFGCENSLNPIPPSKIILKPEASITDIEFIQNFDDNLQKYESVMIGFNIKNCGNVIINSWEVHFKIITAFGYIYESSKMGFNLKIDETTFGIFSVSVGGNEVILVKCVQIELI